MRRTLAVAVTLVLALVVVQPAFGGPDPLAVAKKALRIATGTQKKLKRSYNLTHPADVILVDGGEKSALPINAAEWDVKCPRDYNALNANIGNGALDAVYVGSYGRGILVSLVNPSPDTAYSGNVQVACVWGLSRDRTARVAGVRRSYPAKRAVWRAMRRAERHSKLAAVAQAACTRAKIEGKTKCIGVGQYCRHTRRANRDYHRYGYHCGRRDGRGRYHLIPH